MSIKAEVLSIVEQLSPDELRVFRFMGRRMIDIGHVKYGPLDLAVMRRVWRAEMAQETADRLFYEQCHEIAREDARADRVRCFKADADFAKVDEALTDFVSASDRLPTPGRVSLAGAEAVATFDVRDGEAMEILPPGAEVLP